jgi:hypothetical protein
MGKPKSDKWHELLTPLEIEEMHEIDRAREELHAQLRALQKRADRIWNRQATRRLGADGYFRARSKRERSGVSHPNRLQIPPIAMG